MTPKLFFLASCLIISPALSATRADIDVKDTLNRLGTYIKLIDNFNKFNSKQIPMATKINPICPEKNCQHELIKLCFKKMIAKKEVITPLVETWNLFNGSFQCVEMELFVTEFTYILYAVYQHVSDILNQAAIRGTHEFSIDEIIILYNKVSSLPIIKVIAALEELYFAFHDLMQEYGLQSEMDWGAWIKANWWVPPVVLGSVLITILQRKHLKRAFVERFVPSKTLQNAA